MIKTTIYLALSYSGPNPSSLIRTVHLRLAIEAPYKIEKGEEFDLNDEEWLAVAEKARFNLATMQLEVFLKEAIFEHAIEWEDSKAELEKLGWVDE